MYRVIFTAYFTSGATNAVAPIQSTYSMLEKPNSVAFSS